MEVDQKPKPKHPRKVCYTSEHSDLILHGLNEQRQRDLYCDIVLIAEHVRFPAHRNILATCSNYFNTMFTIGMKETYQKEVELVDSSAIGCKAVLDFLYGNEVLLDIVSVDYVLETAHLLQISKLVDLCCDYLEMKLNEENYLHFQELASIYSLHHLDSSIDSFILRNFQRFSRTPEFIERLPVKKLCLYLDSDQVPQKVEHELLKIALHWLNHCPPRAKEAFCVLQNIRFSLISRSDLLYLVKPAVSFLFPQQENCLSFIDEAISYHNNVAAQPMLQNRRSTLRADGDRLLFFGGDLAVMVDDFECDFNAVESKGVFFLDPENGAWILETLMPASHISCCVAVLGNFIFCAGEFELDKDDGQKTTCLVYRYDPRWKQWTKMASLNQGRRTFCLVALKDRLVAVGGEWKNDEVLASVEIYNPQKDSWCFVAKLPSPTYAHAGTAYKECIYISGGVSNQSSLPKKSLLCYDYHTDTWEKKMDMHEARSLHSMCTLDNDIYAISGTEAIEETFHHGVHHATFSGVESYSPLCDQWTVLAPLPLEPCYTAVAVWRGQIYVLGGEPWDSLVPLKIVQMYNRKKNIWVTETNLPDFIYKMSACVCVLQPVAETKDTN